MGQGNIADSDVDLIKSLLHLCQAHAMTGHVHLNASCVGAEGVMFLPVDHKLDDQNKYGGYDSKKI